MVLDPVLETIERSSGRLLDGTNPCGMIGLTASGRVVLDEPRLAVGWVEANVVIAGPKSRIKDKQSRVVAGLLGLNWARNFCRCWLKSPLGCREFCQSRVDAVGLVLP